MDNADRNLARIAQRQHGVVTREQAAKAGLGEDAIDYRVATRTWTRLHPGVYALTGTPSTYHQVVLSAVLAAGQPVVASGRTAAKLWGLPVSSPRIDLTVPKGRTVSVRGAKVHRRTVMPPSAHRYGIPLTPVEWTMVALSGELPVDELATVMDFALGHKALSLPRLEAIAVQLGAKGRKGSAVLTKLIAERTGRRSTTFIENRFRRIIRARGLAQPAEQHVLVLPSGNPVVIDFAWLPWRLAVEIDSFTHHSSLTDWSHDHIRNQRILSAGWHLLQVTSVQMEEDPKGVGDLMERTLERLDRREV